MRRLCSAALLSSMVLAACVPIPLPGKIYVPINADGSPPARESTTVCAANEIDNSARRQIGKVEIRVFEPRTELNNSDSRADFYLVFQQPATSGAGQSVRVNPALIRLQEEGRVLTPQMTEFQTSEVPGAIGRRDFAALKFPEPSGLADRVRLVFQPGAVRIGGRSVTLAPIDFKRISDPTIYFFPCIPS